MRFSANGTDGYKEITTAPALLEACESVRRQTRAQWRQHTVERLNAVETDHGAR